METLRKHRRGAPPGFFRVEAAGLAWLADAGAVRVARVLAVDDDSIELERLPHAPATLQAAEAFGRDLAALHDAGAHGGHRITDLAMLALFGAPQLGRVLAAYAEASEHLPDRWRDLVPLHQVHPLLVHAVLFGGGYVAQAERAASEALSLP